MLDCVFKKGKGQFFPEKWCFGEVLSQIDLNRHFNDKPL